jgi:flagellar basal body-associated protein FliL
MKRNELIALVIALVLLVGAGYYFLSQSSGSGSSSAAAAAIAANQVEVAPSIAANLDEGKTLDQMDPIYHVKDFKQTPDLSNLGNNAPFGQ